MTDTPIDTAHAAMMADETDLPARLRFFGGLADSTLFLLLAQEAEGDEITPEVFPVENTPFMLAFDTEDRLAAFTGKPAPYAAISGRAIASMIRGQGIGLGLNLEVAPSQIMLPPEVVDWMAEVVTQSPEEAQGGTIQLSEAGEIPPELTSALQSRLAASSGLASGAWLLRDHGDLLLLIADTPPDAQRDLAKSVAEAAGFAGATALDVGFVESGTGLALRAAAIGSYFDVPEPKQPTPHKPAAPGSDPDKPPRLH